MIVVYVAGPYTGTPWNMNENLHTAQRRGRDVAELGAMPLIPHSNTPPFFVGTQNAAFWYEGTLELLKRSDALIVVPGYRLGDSTGTDGELQYCDENGLPVFFDLATLRAWLATKEKT